MALIEVSDLSFGYSARAVLAGIDLTIEPGARLAVLGGNGSGKSTLAQWLAGWLPGTKAAASGHVNYRGRAWAQWPLAERASAVQLVGQIPAQHLSGRAFTVREEIAFGPENLGLPAAEIEPRIDDVISLCRLDHLADRDPFTLSGGEQQRLVIASALALQPDLLILDEPFTNLDPQSRDHVVSLLRNLPQTTAIVLFETGPSSALQIADDFVLLDGGSIRARGGAHDVLLHPAAIAALGLPAVSRAFRALFVDRNISDQDLPLTLDEASAFLRGRSPC